MASACDKAHSSGISAWCKTEEAVFTRSLCSTANQQKDRCGHVLTSNRSIFAFSYFTNTSASSFVLLSTSAKRTCSHCRFYRAFVAVLQQVRLKSKKPCPHLPSPLVSPNGEGDDEANNDCQSDGDQLPPGGDAVNADASTNAEQPSIHGIFRKHNLKKAPHGGNCGGECAFCRLAGKASCC